MGNRPLSVVKLGFAVVGLLSVSFADGRAAASRIARSPEAPVGREAAGAILELPFPVTDAIFDPLRPYLYVSRKVERKVSFVNLETGAVEHEFHFSTMPESLALAPDGSRLFVALLAREHSPDWSDAQGHEGYVASFDLATQALDRQFRIGEDPFDLLATSDGHLVVSSGSGYWTHIRVFDAVDGAETGAVSDVFRQARLALHPSEVALYSADERDPSYIRRYDLLEGGGIIDRWYSPYGEDRETNGLVWASPLGDVLVTGGGDIHTAADTRPADMQHRLRLTGSAIADLAWDAARRVFFTVEGATLNAYNMLSCLPIEGQALPEAGRFVGVRGDTVYVLMGDGPARIVTFAHPATEGASNTAPEAHFTVTPPGGGTTQADLLFDASASFDAEDPPASLRYRWDLDGNGTWDTSFGPSPTVTKRFRTAGTRQVRLQVRDSLALVDEQTGSINVTFVPDPGSPGSPHEPFVLPYYPWDAVFDPARPYLYAAAGRTVYFVNLTTGLVEREFTLDHTTEALALTPDGSRLFAALLTRPHSHYWFDAQGHEGYLASFDLATTRMDRYFRIAEDPYGFVATSDGRVVVSSGSGQHTRIRVFDAATGQEVGSSAGVYEQTRLALHPSESRVYGAESVIFPADIVRYGLAPGGGISQYWDSPYHGTHRFDGDVWASPQGDVLVTRGGDVFTAGETQPTDMIYLHGLSQGTIEDLAWDLARRVIFTVEGTSLHFYNLDTHIEIGAWAVSGYPRFVGVQGQSVYAISWTEEGTRLLSFGHPAPDGGSNTAPDARLAVSPPDRTTRTDLVLDASASSDAQDPVSSLRFRWDLNDDGAWDTGFLPEPTLTTRYNTGGTKRVRMQVRDSLALVDDTVLAFDVTFEPDPGTPGPAHTAFELPFAVTDAAFDPVRPYLYVSRKADRKVDLVNLETGLVEKEFSFLHAPESLAVAPDGSRLFVALLAREHDPYWSDDEGHEGYVASVDLGTGVKDREFLVLEDPFDMLVTGDGRLVVSSGSGQHSYVRVFDAATGLERGSAARISAKSRLRLHPSGTRVYAADTELGPSDIQRYDLLAAGGIAFRWDSLYHGDHRMHGNVWASPVGDVLVTRGGDVFAVGDAEPSDMVYLHGLSPGNIDDLAWDAARRAIFTAEGPAVRYYNLESHVEFGSMPLPSEAAFVGISGDTVYALLQGSPARIVPFVHPAPSGGSNTAPVARFTVDPPTGRTTQIALVFDASASSDAQDMLSSLWFRWDFDGDGRWDTEFLPDPTIEKRYNTGGIRQVRLQVRDSLALLDDEVVSVDVAFEPDPGTTGPAHLPFELPFAVTDAVFDPARPFLYVSRKSDRRVDFVDLRTGLIEREFTFQFMPESLALSPDGSRLFVALLAREHDRDWFDAEGHEGYVASFDLAAGLKDREFRILEDPFDMVVTSDGRLVVSSGSGQHTYVRVLDAATGVQRGAPARIGDSTRLELHPSETKVYAASTDLTPSEIWRYDLPAGGGITSRWDSPYHGHHRMDGDVWASPFGDVLITRGGDVFTAGDDQAGDMTFLFNLSSGWIDDLAWDFANSEIVTAEDRTIGRYDLVSFVQKGVEVRPGTCRFVGVIGSAIYALRPSESGTAIDLIEKRSGDDAAAGPGTVGKRPR